MIQLAKQMCPLTLRRITRRYLAQYETERLVKLNARNRNSIFLWVPKTAGTSLVSVLARHHAQQFLSIDEIRLRFRNRGIVTFGHMSLPDLVEAGLVESTFVAAAWKFAFVRNPFDRAVSLYEYLRGKGLPSTSTFSIFCRYLEEHAFQDVGLYNHLNLNQLNPQAAWLLDRNGNLLPNFVGRFERFDTDAQKVCKELRLPQDNLTFEKHNVSTRRQICEYYRDEQIEIVRQAYRIDFEQFGYSTEPYWK